MTLEGLARAAGLAFAAAVLAAKLHQAAEFPGSYAALRDYYVSFGWSTGAAAGLWALRAAVWVLETGIALGYAAAFATRVPARAQARGFMETAFPLLAASLPFLITASPYTFDARFPASSPAHAAFLGAALALMAAGEALNLWGLLALRRSFSIMSEARLLVVGGPFARIRHPLYAGHFVAFLGYTALHAGAATVLLYLAFLACQRVRAGVEERKLAAAFPEYEAYRARTGMFFPRSY